MEELRQQLIRICLAANISIDPDKESIDLKEIFMELRHKGLIEEQTLQNIENALE